MVKLKTINLNSVRLNTVALNHIGEIRSGGGDSKPSPIPQWIREHVVFYYDVKKQGATNETLKESAYLQDLSGKGRRMKLINFLFDRMSGMNGYIMTSFDDTPNGSTKILWEHVSKRVIKGSTKNPFGYWFSAFEAPVTVMRFKWHVEGIVEGNRVYACQYTVPEIKVELHNGDNDITIDINESSKPNYPYISVISDQPYDTDITITQIPEYPGALVTDGVNDYGLVENLSSGVKMLFMTINTFSQNRYIYEQRKEKDILTFSVLGKPGGDDVAYNWKNNGHTYIDGVLNNTITSANLLNKKYILTIVNDDVTVENTKTPRYFATDFKNYPSKLAFYNSIAFDSIPTEADGFTEQELIDYVITNIIGQ